MHLFPARLVVLDTETTGFPEYDWTRVVELGAVILDTDGTEIDSWSTLIRPDVLDERAANALAVNHITPDMLVGAPSTEAAALAFREWLKRVNGRYVTAFNVAFDRPMVARMGLADLQWASCVMERAMDVMGPAGVLAPGRRGGWRFPRLAAAAEHFGVTVEGDAHRALTDARTAARVAAAIRRAELTPTT